jgi:asparagine synthase (glutamine-hydrolysing)
MCGIAGIYENSGQRVSRELLLAMAGELQHRGPDGTGLYLDGPFGMVNTRLAIVDLERGDQPLPNEDGRFWVMQNGEIYNAPELRAELEALGHRFATRCDTEVLVHAWEQWGTSCLDHLNGAFAFAVWDREQGELFLARDRFGIRPLFLAQLDGAWAWASEGKALLRHPRLSRTLDPLALVETLSLWAPAPDRSAFLGVRELAPGCFLRIGPKGAIEERCWWDLRFATPQELRRESEEELAEELLALLEDATRLRLRADVPVGAYISGGLDSSATAAIVRRLTTQTLRSFAVCFEDPRFDERQYQRRMAQELETEISSVELRGPEIAEIFPEVIRLAEKPILRTAPAPLLFLSQEVHRNGFKVVLTGEGADEVFAGYNIFREDKVRRFWAKAPNSRLRPLLLRRLYPYLAQDLGRAGAFTEAFFGKRLAETDHPLYSHLIRFENTGRCQRLLNRSVLAHAAEMGDPVHRLIERLPAAFEDFSPLARAQYLESKTFLQGYLLHSQGDRMLMGNSVEGRFPFLDHRVAEFAARLPDRMRLRALREKHLLRKAVAPLLPPEIARREKRPYRAPIHRAFVAPDAPEFVEELLSPEALSKAGYFQAQGVGRLRAKCHRNLERGVSEVDEMALVAVLSTMLLNRCFVEKPQLAAPAQPTKVVQGGGPFAP